MSTLLDTNVVSGLMHESPDPSVARWVSGHPVEDLFLSAVSEAELRYGAAILPSGRRRDTLSFKIEAMLSDALPKRRRPSVRGSAYLPGDRHGRPMAVLEAKRAGNDQLQVWPSDGGGTAASWAWRDTLEGPIPTELGRRQRSPHPHPHHP